MANDLERAQGDSGGAPALTGAGAVVEAWLAGRASTTRRAYASDLSHFSRWWDGRVVPEWKGAGIDALLRYRDGGPANSLVLQYRNAMTAAGLSAATVSRRLAAIRSLVKLARTLGRVTWSVEIEGPKPEPRRDVRGPNAQEFAKVWKCLKALGEGARARRDRAMVALLFGLGLRRNEVLGLDLADIDFPSCEVRVVGKGKREKAPFPISREVSRALSDWVVMRGNRPGPLFTRTDRPGSADRLTGEGLARAVARAGEAAGLIKKLRPHGLRHSGTTLALSGGKTLREVKGFTRHEKIETVMKYDDEVANLAGGVVDFLGKHLK